VKFYFELYSAGYHSHNPMMPVFDDEFECNSPQEYIETRWVGPHNYKFERIIGQQVMYPVMGGKWFKLTTPNEREDIMVVWTEDTYLKYLFSLLDQANAIITTVSSKLHKLVSKNAN
jgi:hypothetical protein